MVCNAGAAVRTASSKSVVKVAIPQRRGSEFPRNAKRWIDGSELGCEESCFRMLESDEPRLAAAEISYGRFVAVIRTSAAS